MHKPHVLGWFNHLHQKTKGYVPEKVSNDFETFLSELKAIKSSDDQETFLKEKDKILFIQTLKRIGRDDDLMLFAKIYRDSSENYTIYCEYYLKPWFDSLRRSNRLTQGKKMHFVLIFIVLGQKQIKDQWGEIVEYSGEILDGDKATGLGGYTNKKGMKLSGNFVNDMLEGASVEIYDGGHRFEGEYRENKSHGKSTLYGGNGVSSNIVYDNGKFKSEKNIKDRWGDFTKEKAFYIGGVPHRALQPN